MKMLRKQLVIAALAVMALTGLSGIADAQNIFQVCETDIQKYCSKVKPGHGRLITCLYAHEDQISDACDQATGEMADQLDWFLHRVKTALEQCTVDIEKHCAKVALGEGRIYRCLKDKKAEISGECKQVVDTVTERLVK